MKFSTSFLACALGAMLPLALQAEPVKPLKALLVLGGCCHDYEAQKDLLKAGLESRIRMVVDVCYAPEKNTAPKFSCYENDQWADGYDVIIHDECAAATKDPVIVNRVLEPHRRGLPAVNLHCAMHSFRVAQDVSTPQVAGTPGAMWFEYLGLQSSGHGKQSPIDVAYLPGSSSIVAGLKDWTTIKEELYNNIQIFPGITPVARGKQLDQDLIVAWTNFYGPQKTRVFSTTLGHNNETVADARYLDLVSRGILWACNKLKEDGSPAEGYGPAK